MAAIGYDVSGQATRIDEIGGRFDPWLLGAVVALACLGVVMVGSAAIAGGGQNVGPWYFLVRHAVYLGIGIAIALVVMRMELKQVEQYAQWLLLACFLLLLVLWLPHVGKTINGARRWLNLGPASFQVVELVKVFYLVWLASYLKRYSEEVAERWYAMIKPAGMALLLVGMLMLQPDFGSSMLLLGITVGMLVLGGAPLKRLVLPILLLLPGVVALVILEPYRMRRVTSFMDPWQDQLGAGYQLSNALMAIGRGEWLGVGLGGSVQKLSYLPMAHTDFIFSVVAEELGLVGVALVIGLYGLLVGRAFWLGLKCIELRRHFAGYLAFGIALWMGMQSFISMGVNLGLLPTKGLTLPLVSYGGSSVVMTCAALGLLLRVSYEYERAVRQVARRKAAGALAPVAAADAGGTAGAAYAAASARVEPARARVEPVLGKPARPESPALAALRRAR
ncbi:putative lipid II flippase FtsW [Thermomonas haemolytica]|uniref:Probable peptidoglycan glycosyltransferase FtsW n=1 Tax=Thermomonas haemolytica TaxID=141949 RepID=A0A4V6P019_9GAMM|nr:putative lipid II flippase FtsW [Thermomonas haemolytica]TCT24682.1 cell division-specific peptidoglycan biosynthesis regulator FtsW [Thermomonas haemolytica]TNY28345.1 putative lipid II flippase FtsW [Thermomonas haemolytica]